eukprot:6171198-Pleurochrysis_carterae.AAC.1
MVLARSQPSYACSSERKTRRCAMFSEWALRKVRRMGLAEGPSHEPCRKSTSQACSSEGKAGRCAIFSEWALRKVRRMDLA